MKAWFVNIAAVAVCTILWVGLPSTAHADVWSQVRSADQAISAWDYPAAKKVVQRLQKTAPNHPGTQYVSGKLDYHLGRYDDAVRQLQAALEHVPSQQMFRLRTLLTRVRATRDLVANYKHYRSKDGHFDILYTPRDEFLMPFVAATLEAAYYNIGFNLGYWPKDTVRVEMYPRAKLLGQVSSLPEEAIKTTSTIGLCKYNKIMVTSPSGTLRGYRWRDTLAHEYVHMVISKKTHNGVPIWMHEGIAKFMETRWRDPTHSRLDPSRESLLAKRIQSGNLISLEEMSPSIALLPSQEDASVAYAEVYTLVQYLLENEGAQAIRRVLDAIAGGASAKDAVAQVSGHSWPTFEHRWMRWLKHDRDLHETPVDFSDEPVLKENQEAEENGQFAGVSSSKARDHLQLGQLLRARGLGPGALAEYRRAEAILGPVHPMVQNGLAAVLLKENKPKETLRALKDATRWFPDYYDSYVHRAQAYNDLHQYKEALAASTQAFGINPFDPAVLKQRARAFEGLGQADAARRVQKNLADLQ